MRVTTLPLAVVAMLMAGCGSAPAASRTATPPGAASEALCEQVWQRREQCIQEKLALARALGGSDGGPSESLGQEAARVLQGVDAEAIDNEIAAADRRIRSELITRCRELLDRDPASHARLAQCVSTKRSCDARTCAERVLAGTPAH
jgi:uncharacterized protein YceK